MREPSLSERVRKPWKQLIDVHENSGFNREKKTLRGRVLVVTAVMTRTCNFGSCRELSFRFITQLPKFRRDQNNRCAESSQFFRRNSLSFLLHSIVSYLSLGNVLIHREGVGRGEGGGWWDLLGAPVVHDDLLPLHQKFFRDSKEFFINVLVPQPCKIKPGRQIPKTC